jgi:formate dehydrogenase maturation protein FdhE
VTRASSSTGESGALAGAEEQGALVTAAFEEHAERATVLAGERRAVRAPLLLAASLYRAQAAVARRLLQLHAVDPLTGLAAADAPRVAAALAALWDAAAAGPAPLAEAARARASEPVETSAGRLVTTFSEGGGDDWLSRAALRPWLSALTIVGVQPRHPPEPTNVAAADGVDPARKKVLPILDAGSVGGVVLAAHGKLVAEGGRCPFCAGRPWVASRRILPETDGATRFLHCSLCGGEWRVNRIRCPWCAEEDPAKLPHYQLEAAGDAAGGDAVPASGARLEGCETCGRYTKSIDRSTDMRRVPEVDDVATLGLDLWAEEQGMTRGEPGLLGL